MTTCRCLTRNRRLASGFLRFLSGGGLLILGWISVCAEPIVSEFLTRNETGYRDDDGDRSDWIELHNPDSTDINLAGWFLTDDRENLQKWVFPSIVLGANQYRLVFASGKNRSQLGSPLHTNFRLRSEGEYLALANPQAEVVFEFAPQYPRQFPDVSFGRERRADSETVLLPIGAPARAFVPADDRLSLRWTETDFDDEEWKFGRTGVGYGYRDLLGLDTQEMRGENPTVYVRIPFHLDALPDSDRFILRFRYEDGFVAYLNGRRIASDNAPAALAWNSASVADRPDAEAQEPVDINITAAGQLLRTGNNVLAIHGLNRTLTSSDILFLPELIGVKANNRQNKGFMFSPSLRMPNRPAVRGVLESPVFSVSSRLFVDKLEVHLAKPDSAPEDAVIRYTLDGEPPDEDSTLFAKPLILDQTTQLRARLLGADGSASPVVGESYIQLHREVANFTSDLPLIVLENFRNGRPPQNAFQPGFMGVIERGANGRSALAETPKISTRVGLKVRGSSTAGRPKPSISLEARDAYDQDRGIAPLGLPRDADWVLWGPYNFDLTLMHNPFIYELSNQIGRYAPRTRFVEVFFNMGGGPLRSNDYFGVYALTEKIKRDGDRVDLDQLFPEHDREPKVTGGYLLKIDRADPGDSGFRAAGQTLRYVYPKEEIIEQPDRQAQKDYLNQFFAKMERALNGRDFRDPQRGYAQFIDVGAAIDHHLLNVLALNVDALRLSGYMSLPRNGKLTFGPIWDFDRALGSTDGRDAFPSAWRGSGQGGTDFFNYPWWKRMFQDIDFFQKYIDRFQGLRRRQFSDSHINGIIDQMADELREAQARNLDRWKQNPRGRYGRSYQGEVDHMKDWLAERIQFMESQFIDPPVFRSTGRAEKKLLRLTSPEGGDIYYTLDGSDPREPGGEISQSAQKYSSPIALTESAKVTARVRNREHKSLTGANNPPLSSQWSGPVSALYSLDKRPQPGDLRIAELHYNPLPPNAKELELRPNLRARDFEFFELQNQTSQRLELAGLQITGGVFFAFPSDDSNILAPGKSATLVGNQEAFALRYGFVDALVVEYRGALDDDADEIQVIGADGVELIRAAYSDERHPATDGHGFSLKPLATANPQMLGALDWAVGSRMGGSPGMPNSLGTIQFAVRVNEVLNNSDPPELDAVELANFGNETTSIGGWYLTDDLQVPRKYRLPEGTTMEPGSFLVLDETDFGQSTEENVGFRFSSLGEEVYLFAASNGELQGYADGFRFRALPPGQTQGPWMGTDGKRHIVAFQSSTLGAANSEPLIGPIVISEIFAAPQREPNTATESDFEFVEIVNIHSSAVALRDLENRDVGWRIRGGIRFDLPAEWVLDPGERLLITPFDPNAERRQLAAFRNRWRISHSVKVAGPFLGRLENSGDSILLERPDFQLSPEANQDGEIPFVLVDFVDYLVSDPWPMPASANQSLQRIENSQFGRDPSNWLYDSPTPGKPRKNRAPSILSISIENDGVRLEIAFNDVGSYSVQRSEQLNGQWKEMQRLVWESETSSTVEVKDPSPLLSQQFYRVVLLP